MAHRKFKIKVTARSDTHIKVSVYGQGEQEGDTYGLNGTLMMTPSEWKVFRAIMLANPKLVEVSDT